MTTGTQIEITDEDIRAVLHQKVNQVTNLELQAATLSRVINERDVKIAELEGDQKNAKGRK